MRNATLYEVNQAIASVPKTQERKGNQIITRVNVADVLKALLKMERNDDSAQH